MKAFGITMAVCITIAVLWVGCSIFGAASWFADRSVAVAKQQLDPAELLRKYEWFKDASAQLDKKQADISVYQDRFNAIDKRYAGREMPRTIAEQYMIWQQELSGVKASYNELAAEYNAQMAKINWRFCNVGDLPAGATEPLPRAYKPYETH